MASVGFIGLVVAFAGALAAVVCLLVSIIKKDAVYNAANAAANAAEDDARLGCAETRSSAETRSPAQTCSSTQTRQTAQTCSSAEKIARAGHIATFVVCAALTLCCGVLVYCFFAGDYSISYVLNQHSSSTDSFAWFYKLSGLWAGREGSLLFWAWLISLFGAVMAARNYKTPQRLDTSALFVLQIVLLAFVGVLLFSPDNMPFAQTPTKYFKDGALTSMGSMLGMNQLLEHWAMAAHPPTLFIGYAGMTVPFAYAIAALITNNSTSEWAHRSHGYALFSWLFLSIGIGLGSVWAYVVLGWGGYWGWDAVENASLLSWLVGTALIHSMTVYRQRGAFKRWGIMCACFTFAFVILGTFITRSGIVQSVHAFDGDAVSAILFGGLICVSILAGAVGLGVRWKSFGPAENGTDDVESLCTKEGAYYFNNVVMFVSAIVIAYLTVSSALPSFLPFGNKTVSSGTYNSIARPLGIVYLLILSCCPLLHWGKTSGKDFWRAARVPGACALVLFIVLAVYWGTYLVPSYNDIIAGGGSAASELSSDGPAWYYNGLALFGFLVASLLFFNALSMLVRTGRNIFKQPSRLGGFITHAAMGIILVGLIGSSMYVSEVTQYVKYDENSNTSDDVVQIQNYTLKYAGTSTKEAGSRTTYEVLFDVYSGDNYLGQVHPSMEVSTTTQQQKLNAATLSAPTHDLFVVYQGDNDSNELSMNVRINPLISFVWIGFGLLMVGMLCATIGTIVKGRKRKKAVACKATQKEARDERS